MNYHFKDKERSNGLIGAFMGEKYSHYIYLKFDYSWDWLKPVISKIVTLALEDSERGRLIILSDYYRNVTNFTIIAEIEPVYNNIVEFIKWFNKLQDKY